MARESLFCDDVAHEFTFHWPLCDSDQAMLLRAANAVSSSFGRGSSSTTGSNTVYNSRQTIFTFSWKPSSSITINAAGKLIFSSLYWSESKIKENREIEFGWTIELKFYYEKTR